MTRPIAAVVAEAEQRLERTGRLDIAAFAAAYPEHESELRELLPVMFSLHQEKRWRKAEAESQAFAVALFPQLVEKSATGTVATLFARERTEAGLSVAEQARRSGLPPTVLEQLAQDSTPVSALADNAAIKQLATRVAAPFAALAKEVRRLLSLESLSGMNTGAVFTRDNETSTNEEQQALLDKVRQATRKPPEEQ